MALIQEGAINTTALILPNLYVQIVPPQNLTLNGVPTDIVGLVGTAPWGPVGMPVICGDAGDYAAAFGPVMARTYDMGTHLGVAVQQGAQNFRCVRVTDGTDTKAAATILASLTLTALYSGSLGNGIQATLSPGSAANSSRITIAIPGYNPEVYDNITGTGAALWTNIAAAINNGNSPQRPKSQIVTATAAENAAGAFPTVATTYAFVAETAVTGIVAGTDGATGVTDEIVVGIDTPPRLGMYALRGQGCALVDLCDVTSYGTFTLQEAFGLAEGAEMICQDPAGSVLSSTGITTAITNKQNAGVDTYAVKVMFGDWVYWYDAVNALTRLVSPQAFVVGLMANLSPNESPLNKQMYGILGTQKSGLLTSGTVPTYADADLSALAQAGFDVICNPQPGGSYWGCRIGHNSSSNAVINGDNYTRMTNYIAETLSTGMGIYVGMTVTPRLLLRITNTISGFLANLVNQGLLSKDASGNNPYSVVCNATNNPQSRTSLGYVQADVQVQYQAINEKFIINLEGGVSVVIASQAT